MSGSLLATAFVVACMIVFWRITLLVILAIMIAMLVSGAGYLSAALQANPVPAPTVVVPGTNPAAPLEVGEESH